MAETTIEWTHRHLPDGLVLPGYTFNIAWGCVKVSEGCRHCYADTLLSRYGFSLWRPSAERRTGQHGKRIRWLVEEVEGEA